MASEMDLVKLCMIWLVLQGFIDLLQFKCTSDYGQSISTDLITNIYATEGSTVDLTSEDIHLEPCFDFSRYWKKFDSRKFKTPKYDIVLRSDFQIKNVTVNNTGFYKLYSRNTVSTLELRTANMTPPYIKGIHVRKSTAIEGSSSILTFKRDGVVFYTTINEGLRYISESLYFTKYTIHVDLYIFNVTSEDVGYYRCFTPFFIAVKLHVAKLWFNNQSDLKTIVGQEGKELELKCSTNTVQYITGLNIESNGSIIAMGDNQSVRYPFIPDKTDHLTTYKCVDITHLSIMNEVRLIIWSAPVVKSRYTNETIECDCNGIPDMYIVYRLDQNSKDGKLIRSVNLNNETFTFNTESFPYQKNGRYTCFVSNGIPNSNGNVLQTWSIDVKYEGPPVFAPENRNVKTGALGQSISLSFYIYSYPEVEQIFVENVRFYSIQTKIIKHHSILTSALRYTEYNSTAGIQGYEILIETEVLYISDFQIYHITAKNSLGKSKYRFEIKNTDLVWFKNQTDINTIVGQEGRDMEIKCSFRIKHRFFFGVALIITSNGSFKAIGFNKYVSYSFIPNRTDHLTTYKCEPTARLSISAEVKLIIKYAPAVKGLYTNETIKCYSDGVPAVYSVYRLDHISKYGELVRSVNLSDPTFNITTEPFLYQKNGIYMCVVSNGVPDANGKILQSWTTNVVYEGPPVFASENRNLIHGRIGQSITLSFYIYSNPDVEEIIIENIGPKPMKREQIKHYNILNSTLIYSEYNKLVGIEGYEILIESKVLDINDFHLYRITAKNRLGASNYHFAIIKNENLFSSKKNKSYFVILCSIATVLFVYLIIMHVCICVKHIRTRDQRHQNVGEDHNYHTYDEIGTISYRNLHALDTDDNEGVNLTEQHEAGISTSVNPQSTDDITTEVAADVLDDYLPQREVSEVQVQRQFISTTSDNTNRSNTDSSQISSTVISIMENIANCNQTDENTNTETSSDQMNQTSNDSDSDTSNNVMIDNVGEYENNYQLQESHLYIEILEDRQNSISSTDSNSNE